jgi:hypothetical protein
MARQAGLTPAPVTEVHADATFDGPMVNVAGFDPLDPLPSEAQDRGRKLRLRAADARKVVPPFDEIQDLNIERIKVEREVRRQLASPHDGGFNLSPSDHRVQASQKRLDKLSAEVKRLSELREIRLAAWQTTARTLDNVEAFLKSGKPGGTVLELFEGPEPKLAKGETILDGIERLRRRGRELLADLHRIRSAPYPSSFAKQLVREQVEQLAQRGAPNISGLVEHGDGKIEELFPRQLARAQVFNVAKSPAATAYFELVSPPAILAWLFKDQLIAALGREIDAEADDKAALTHEQRQQREAEVQGDLLSTERDICSLIWRGQAEGLPVEFPADISPLALLGLRLVTAPRAVPSFGSSPEHAVSFGPGR